MSTPPAPTWAVLLGICVCDPPGLTWSVVPRDPRHRGGRARAAPARRRALLEVQTGGAPDQELHRRGRGQVRTGRAKERRIYGFKESGRDAAQAGSCWRYWRTGGAHLTCSGWSSAVGGRGRSRRNRKRRGNLLINTPEALLRHVTSLTLFRVICCDENGVSYLGTSLVCFHDSYVRSSSDSRVSVNMKFVQ